MAASVTGAVATGVYTTNHFHFRLCRALRNGKGGTFSGELSRLDDATRIAIIDAVTELPAAIATVPLRTLIGSMVSVAESVSGNVLALEAIAAALHVGAPILGATANLNPRIQEAAQRYSFEYRVIDVEW